MPGGRFRLHLAVLLGYVAVAVLFTWPLTLHMNGTFPGDPAGDTGVYVWNLWVFRHQILVHHTLPFLTREILSLDAPAVPLTLHNYTTFADVLAFPLLEWLSPVTTFNLLTIGSLAGAAYAMFVYALRRTGNAAAAFIGGLVFGFNPFMTARAVAHFSLVQAAPLPVFGLLLFEIFQRPTTRLAAAAGLVVAWAFLCDPYYAVYCLLMVMFVVGYSLVAVERRPASVQRVWWRTVFDLLLLSLAGLIAGIGLRGGGRLELFGLRVSVTRLYTPVLLFTVLLGVRIWLSLRPRFAWARVFRMAHLRVVVVAGFVCAMALSPVLYAMRSPIAGRPWRGPQVLWRSSAPGIDAAAWLTPNPYHPFWGSATGGWLASMPNGPEENIASIPLVALAVIAFAIVWRRFRAPGGWWVFTGLAAWLSLGPFVHLAGINTYVPTPWAVLRYLPVIGAARMPTRMTVLVMMGLSMLLAFAVAHICQHSRRSRVVAAAIAVLLVFELVPSPLKLYSAEIPGVYRIIAADPRPIRGHQSSVRPERWVERTRGVLGEVSVFSDGAREGAHWRVPVAAAGRGDRALSQEHPGENHAAAQRRDAARSGYGRRGGESRPGIRQPQPRRLCRDRYRDVLASADLLRQTRLRFDSGRLGWSVRAVSNDRTLTRVSAFNPFVVSSSRRIVVQRPEARGSEGSMGRSSPE